MYSMYSHNKNSYMCVYIKSCIFRKVNFSVSVSTLINLQTFFTKKPLSLILRKKRLKIKESDIGLLSVVSRFLEKQKLSLYMYICISCLRKKKPYFLSIDTLKLVVLALDEMHLL